MNQLEQEMLKNLQQENINNQFANWYASRHGIIPSRDMVLPVQHALQGHPGKSGALWEGFINMQGYRSSCL